jgi:hypothetical protein
MKQQWRWTHWIEEGERDPNSRGRRTKGLAPACAEAPSQNKREIYFSTAAPCGLLVERKREREEHWRINEREERWPTTSICTLPMASETEIETQSFRIMLNKIFGSAEKTRRALPSASPFHI